MEKGTLNWGKCRVITGWTYAGSSAAALLPLPVGVEDSTTLETEEGDETEGTIEGGEVECVRYNRNKYTINVEVRSMTGRKKPIKDSDGVTSGSGWVLLVPEDCNSYGLLMQSASGRLVDSYTAADGGRLAYAFKAQKASTGDQCKWGVVTIKDSDSKAITDIDQMTADNIKSITFDPIEVEGETKESTITVFTAS